MADQDVHLVLAGGRLVTVCGRPVEGPDDRWKMEDDVVPDELWLGELVDPALITCKVCRESFS